MNLNSSKEKAVGIKSVTELDQLKKAFELYRTDKGKYPGEGTSVVYDVGGVDYTVDDIGWSGTSLSVVDFLNKELILNGYISEIPYYVSNKDLSFTYIVGIDILKKISL